MKRKVARVALLVASGLAIAAPAQTIPYVPGFNFADGLHAWRPAATSPTLMLVGNGDAPPVKVWLGEADSGIVILGWIDTQVTYAADLDAMRQHDFVRLRLATATDVALPPLGWPDRFDGFVPCSESHLAIETCTK